MLVTRCGRGYDLAAFARAAAALLVEVEVEVENCLG